MTFKVVIPARYASARGAAGFDGGGVAEVEGFLSTLAVEGKVAAGTQNQALSALLFLYKEVLSNSRVPKKHRNLEPLLSAAWRHGFGVDGRSSV